MQTPSERPRRAVLAAHPYPGDPSREAACQSSVMWRGSGGRSTYAASLAWNVALALAGPVSESGGGWLGGSGGHSSFAMAVWNVAFILAGRESTIESGSGSGILSGIGSGNGSASGSGI